MSFIDRLFKNEPKNEVQPETQRARQKDIILQQLDRAKADISLWRNGLDEWEDIYYPDRTSTIQLYREILNDDTVSGYIESTKNRILANSFDVVDKNGNIIEDKHLLFDRDWFEQLVEHFVIAELIGYRLIEVMPLKRGEIDPINDFFNIPDHYLIPEWRRIMRGEGNHGDMISYDPKPLELIEFGDPFSKGLLNSIAPLYIYKKNAMAYWSVYQSKFGVPPILAKTDLGNEQGVQDLSEFLGQMASNSFAIVDTNDQIEKIQMGSTDGYLTFREMIIQFDSAIRKRLEGQTMTSDDGSSRSQAEVHERTGDLWFYGRMQKFKRLVNNQIVPLLASYGFDISETDRIRFHESKDIDAVIDRTVKLYQAGLQVDADWLEEEIGMPLNMAFESGDVDEETMNKIMGKHDR